ncbi:MAG: GntR family transcriptional regulator [Gemmatimonadetes bacterium]|nr:GntR family transcriptional regulator [Gemmatimonadota bacterium]
MFDDIDPRSPTPLYAQIAARVRMAIAAGELAPGAGLPSVRALSRSLRVNPATVVQAYRDLALDGFVDLRHGHGTFVRDVPASRREEERSVQAAHLVRQLLQDAARAGIGVEDLAQALRTEAGVEIRE